MLLDEDVEILVREIHHKYGYDFSGYARPSLIRRISRLYLLDNFTDFNSFRITIKADRQYFYRFIEEITVNLTEMFRDPEFFRVLRTDVLPCFSTLPLIRIWLAGCSTGEEAISTAIILKELNLLDKSVIYATDLNQASIRTALNGNFSLQHMKQYSQNYINAGGTQEFSGYYETTSSVAVFSTELLKRILFSTHNLVSDGSFNLFNLIICRNVLIYFDKALQAKIFRLFDQSLGKGCYIGLGSKETIRFSTIASNFSQVSSREKIWVKSALNAL